MNTILRASLPIVVLAAGIALAVHLVATRPEPDARPPERAVPVVRAIVAEANDVRARIESEGTVRPATQSALVSEVSGRVVSVGEAWADGAFFDAGETLLEIDRTDYELALAEAKALVAQAELALAREKEEARIARADWERLGDGGEPPPLVLRVPQRAEAEALLEAARAKVKRAELDLERTRVSVPYAGRVRAIRVDRGQYVARGSAVAEVYSVERAEVRLPLSDHQFAFVDFRLGESASLSAPPGEGMRTEPEVILWATIAGERVRWAGRIVRTEGEIDPRTRRIHVVAVVDDPYRRSGEPGPPLAAGQFVRAEIAGRSLSGVVSLPRRAIRNHRQVLVIDAESRLRYRDVDVVRVEGDTAFVRSGVRDGAGVEDGERICVSPLDVVVDGMLVRVDGEPAIERPSSPVSRRDSPTPREAGDS